MMQEDLFSLKGRVALVTGGNSRLGRAMALGMRRAGAQVVVTGSNPEKNKAITNAGDARVGSVGDVSLEGWHVIIETNLTGSFLCARHAAKVMASQGSGGKIINIGSMYSIFGGRDGANYVASKIGILGPTRALADWLAWPSTTYRSMRCFLVGSGPRLRRV